MNKNQKGVSISIGDKEFMVACPPSERESLTQAAKLLDTQMRDIQKSGKVLGAERAAIMAALNIAHDLILCRNDGEDEIPEFNDRIRALNQKIDSAIGDRAQSLL